MKQLFPRVGKCYKDNRTLKHLLLIRRETVFWVYFIALEITALFLRPILDNTIKSTYRLSDVLHVAQNKYQCQLVGILLCLSTVHPFPQTFAEKESYAAISNNYLAK